MARGRLQTAPHVCGGLRTMPKRGRTEGEVAVAELPDGWGHALLKTMMKEWGAGTGKSDSLLTDEQVDKIRSYVLEDYDFIPAGWCPPDDWRVRSLSKVNDVKDVLPQGDLEDLVDQIMAAQHAGEVPHAWRQNAPGRPGEGSSADVVKAEDAPESNAPLLLKQKVDDEYRYPWRALTVEECAQVEGLGQDLAKFCNEAGYKEMVECCRGL